MPWMPRLGARLKTTGGRWRLLQHSTGGDRGRAPVTCPFTAECQSKPYMDANNGLVEAPMCKITAGLSGSSLHAATMEWWGLHCGCRVREQAAATSKADMKRQLDERVQIHDQERQNMRRLFNSWLHKGELEAATKLARAKQSAQKQVQALQKQ